MFNKYLAPLLAKQKLPHLKHIESLKSAPKTFLVISNTALGDTLLSTPAIKSLKLSFPESKIIVLIHKNLIPLFKHVDYIDAIIPFFGGYKRFFETTKAIKKYAPKMALVFHGNAPLDIYLAACGGCEYILKHPTKTKLKNYLAYDFPKKEQHTIEDRLDLVRKIGGEKLTTKMDIGSFEDEMVMSKISLLLKKQKKYIAFQVGAADVYKMWPIESFVELIKRITEVMDYDIILTGIKSEKGLTKIIKEKFPDRVVNLCGKTIIDELPYLLNRCDLLVTNDTGTMHLAIALKVPTLSLFSPTSSSGIGPYQDLAIHKVIQKDGSYMQKLPKKQRSNEAMKLIGVDEVYHTIQEALA